VALVSVRLDVTPWDRAIDGLGRRAFPAMARAVNRAASSGSVQLSRDVAANLGIGVTGVKKQFTLSQASSGNLVAKVLANARPLSLKDMGARWPGAPEITLTRGQRGFRVTAMRFGKRVRYEGAFVANVKGPLPSGVISPGHEGVFKRLRPSTHKSPGAWSKNLPINELRGPSVWLVARKLAPGVQAKAEEQLVKNLEHELGFALAQVAG